MARLTLKVTTADTDWSRIPDAFSEGAALLVEAYRRGLVTEVGEHLRIRRQGGYCGLDVWVFLVLFLASTCGRGVRGFWELMRPFNKLVAALAGRRRLMSPASLSRALDAVEFELVRPIGAWLLLGLEGMDAMLVHPAMQAVDARGEGWHEFHLDPTVTTLRQRALPADDDLPEPRRRAEDTGAPGYAGRKRGDIQFRRVTVDHAGSGLWVHGHLSPGNGEGIVDLELALDTVAETVERTGMSQDRVLVVADGEYGNVPYFTACRERGLAFITRLNRPQLYEDPDVLRRLGEATWRAVPDSRSGPRRFAADIGTLEVRAGKRTRRADGSRYEPVSVRVVASIFRTDGEAKRGRVIDGWQVELFAVDLGPAAWPAPDAVARYFGRGGQENRFAQEDRELMLDRIISYHLPGQELAVLVGLSLWNLRTMLGFEQQAPPAQLPPRPLREPAPGPDLPEAWPRDPVVARTLGELDWDVLLAGRPGWAFDPVRGELCCEDGRPLTLTTVRPEAHRDERTGIIFRRPTGGCQECDARSGCLHSDRPQAPKHVELSVPTDVADRLRERLCTIRSVTHQPIASPPPGPSRASPSLFLPATARRAFTEIIVHATLHVEVAVPAPEPPRPRLVAADEADRQRRRCTWDQNLARYALPEGTQVQLRAAGSERLQVMLEAVPTGARMASGSSG